MDITQGILNQPIPGESMSHKLGKYPFDNPPEIPSPVDAMQYLLENYLSNNNSDEVLKLIMAGVTLEALSNMIVKSFYMEGVITFDVAEIIKPAFMLHLLADARDAGVEDIRILNDTSISEMSPQDFFDIKRGLRGDEIQTEPIEQVEDTESFLDMENI
tara:strand:+ start:563 stop:1039 length:477 start_codon:yes stop_codon:yes gene_type:complete